MYLAAENSRMPQLLNLCTQHLNTIVQFVFKPNPNSKISTLPQYAYINPMVCCMIQVHENHSNNTFRQKYS